MEFDLSVKKIQCSRHGQNAAEKLGGAIIDKSNLRCKSFKGEAGRCEQGLGERWAAVRLAPYTSPSQRQVWGMKPSWYKDNSDCVQCPPFDFAPT